MNTVRPILRNLINDNAKTNNADRPPDSFIYTSSNAFSLSEANVDSSTLAVYKNGILLDSSYYTYNASTGVLTITGLVAGNIIIVYYSAYLKYSDSELNAYIKAALARISARQYKNFAVGSADIIYVSGTTTIPTISEYNLIALIASILIDGRIRSYRTNEISINFTETESIDVRISKTVEAYRTLEISTDYHNLDYDNE